MELIWQEILSTLREEFVDATSVSQNTRIILRLVLAAALGGILGWEREQKGKSAGLRTHMLVAFGAALFVLAPQQAGAPNADLTRVVQGIITGVGFLGAGSIVKRNASKDEEEVRGLTTAAGIWLTAAVGLAAGLGREVTAILSTILAFSILTLLPECLRLLRFKVAPKQPPSESNH